MYQKVQQGQVNAASKIVNALDLGIPVIGLAEKNEEVYFPHNSKPVILPRRSDALRLLQRIRDEAHRFGITFHRQKRSKSAIVSELDGVGGIGDKTKETLLQHFKSVKRIREATLEELTKVVGFRGKKVYEYFHHP